MTHILFITPYYPPEKNAPAVRNSETAIRLAKRGYKVTVLAAFPNYPTGVVPPEYRGHMIQEEDRDGVHVVRVWSYVRPNKGFLSRILAQLSFGCLAPLFGWKAVGCPDIIIVQSPPLFDAIAGRMLAWLKHCPFIFTVADLWPESAVQLGMLRNRMLIRLAEWLEWSTYQRASAVWALTSGIRDELLKRGLSPEHVFLLTNGVDTNKFHPMPKSQARAKLGWDNRFTVLYAGNHGLVYSMTTALDAAEQLRVHPTIHFIFVGDGPRKEEMMAHAKHLKLDNVTFMDSVSHDIMPLLLAGADTCLIPLRRLPLLKGTLPFKMFELMASARPIILGAEGIARQLAVEEAGAALYVDPENVSELVAAILYLRDHPDVAEKLGQQGRAFVEAKFDREQLTAELEARIAMLLSKKSPDLTSIYDSKLSAPLPTSSVPEESKI